MNQQDIVKISGLKVMAIIGVFAWERVIEQELIIDVTMKTDIGRAAQSDDLQFTINYKDVCDNITLWCQQSKAKLIERLAEIIADGLLKNYDTSEVEVSVAKPNAIKAVDSVSVQIVRTS